jgi:hypothetical protein
MHVEFPELTPEAKAAAVTGLGYSLDRVDSIFVSKFDRQYFAAFLKEALKQATERNFVFPTWELEAIAANLHSPLPPPPPPPPTLAQAQTADLNTPEGRATVSAFLATLEEP